MELRVDTVSCQRGGLVVLEGVNFVVTPGEAVVLRGPNGIGKTTLLRTIAGLQPPVTGTVSAPEDAMAYAGHADGLKGPLSVRQNLEFWAEVYGQRDITPALELYALGPLADRQAQDLSAGQKRRLGLARMMVTGRPIWILDEPTVSLDVANVALFGEMIAAHLAGGGMALMATHIELGVTATTLDLGPYKAVTPAEDMATDEAFL
ncbi:heme ABC exporter ATP-binding protein CcmA [Dinoroseobacter sp. PD6]|uniref:heme ABC exporter ATP-binding protein CcmA n=1 Tax=Dinoroseobacter sp. PD6 TaxID=3028384 RepID=UPI00237A0D4F|nr:heme ABC exporter ATP-binding protein CcmA [Dinoroseobacter sp. PD6]MDD9715303.1 heme ABC exporter ATP-binding protein CcmA [Dinoroseobacter sp. PD6]